MMKPTRRQIIPVLGALTIALAIGGWEAYKWWTLPPIIKTVMVSKIVQSIPELPVASPSKIGLFFAGTSPGTYYQAPVLKTDVQFAVGGTMIRATVRQHFYNPSSRWLEGIYVFPLPDRSGVDRLRMQIGDRFVEGQIQEKIQAKKTYEKARQKGKQVSLISSARENVFTTRVANVGPHQEIIIEIQYGDTVHYSDHVYSLRFPMVVAPRYVPRQVLVNEQGELGMTRVADVEEILSPIHDPRDGPLNPLTLKVELTPGFKAEGIHSLFHPITLKSGSGHQWHITLAQTVVPADRDFVLEWKSKSEIGATATLLAEQVGADTYVHGTLFPPGSNFPPPTSLPTGLTMVVDVSGSMAGTSLTQVAQALNTLFTWLTPEDRFNLITFAAETRALFSHNKIATEANIDAAKRFVEKLEANGGTELLPALQLALSEQGDDLRFQQVIVLTDGAIGYEEQVLSTIQQQLGNKRLFMVGIGSAPNSYLMREASALGRGTFTYIGDVQETAERMVALLKKLKHPAVTNLAIEWPPHLISGMSLQELEMFPAPIPDLYHGEPVTFDVKFPGIQVTQLSGLLRIAGQKGRGRWEQEIPLNNIMLSTGVAKRWAREKISQLMGNARRGKMTQEESKQRIVSLSLAHQLVTRHTSLVAVDQTAARPPGAQLVSQDLETNLPVGWEFKPVINEDLIPSSLVKHHGQLPDQVMAVVPVPMMVALSLPQAATTAQLHLITGCMLLWCYVAGYYLRRQKEWVK